MTAVDRDPDRIPGVAPGYWRMGRNSRLATCDRCGAAVNVGDPRALEFHDRYHVELRALWMVVQTLQQSGVGSRAQTPAGASAGASPAPDHKMPPAPPPATTPGGVRGANQRSERGVGSPPPDANMPREDGGRLPSRGAQRSRPGTRGRVPGREPLEVLGREPLDAEEADNQAYEAWLAGEA